MISLSTQSPFKEFDTLEQEMWNHSLASGFGAQLVAAQAQVANPMRRSLLVSCTTWERLFFFNHYDTYSELILAANANHRFHHEAERNVYGFDHADVGGVLTSKWDLADSLAEAGFDTTIASTNSNKLWKLRENS